MRWYPPLQRWLRRLMGGEDASNPGPKARPAHSRTTIEAPVVTASPVAIGGGKYQLMVGVVSTVGNYREHNEDNYFVPGRPSLQNTPAARPSGAGSETTTIEVGLPVGASGPFIVADGMGGQQAGEKASQMAVEYIPRELMNRLGAVEDVKETQAAIRDGVAAANREILAMSHLGADYANMGTTVVLAVFREERAYVTGIGDSRAYRLREGRLEQLTKDHSLANALGEAGTISPEEVENHKYKHVLYLYLGSKDARDGPEQVRVVDVKVGDRFLLATDGLTGSVRDEEMISLLTDGDDPQRIAQTLVNRALANGSKDNVTSLVIHVV